MNTALLKTRKTFLKVSLLLITILNINLTTAFAQFNGGTGTPSDPYQIANVTQLQAMNTALDKHFVLTQNIDASITSTWNAGAGFEPIGPSISSIFTGSFDGKGFVISKLYINKVGVQGVGLFGNFSTVTGVIQNVGLDSVTVNGGSRTGALVGNKQGVVRNCYSNGTVTGSSTVGGLTGRNGNSETSNSYSTCTVSGGTEVGGLSGSGSFIINCYAAGNVTSAGSAGGLIGEISSAGGNVFNSYATGNVTSTSSSSATGGLIGRVQFGNIDLCYASGNITGNRIGGLIGMSNAATVTRCYSTATLNSSGGFGTIMAGLIAENEYKVYNCYTNVRINYTGSTSNVTLAGLIGRNQDHSEVINTYAVVKFLGSNGTKSGLLGVNEVSNQDTATIINSYWNTDSSGVVPGIGIDQTASQVVTGLTDAQMRLRNSFPLWNFDTLWTINEGVTFPYFKSPGTPCVNTTATDSIRACKSYTWINGTTYTSSVDTASFIIPNTAGCDSIITLKLTIDTININVSVNASVLTAAESSAGTTYQWINCDTNTPITNATNKTYTATVTGNYAVIVSNNSCVDTSVCTNVVVVGINSNKNKFIHVYPNPTTNTIQFNIEKNAEVKLMDAFGRLLFTSTLEAGKQKINLSDFENGIYVLNVSNEENNFTAKIVLQK